MNDIQINFPGHFGFYFENKYYVVPKDDSRKEVLDRKIISELRESLKNGSYETWKTKLKSQNTTERNVQNSLSDILEYGWSNDVLTNK
jgi:hypothetical protein